MLSLLLLGSLVQAQEKPTGASWGADGFKTQEIRVNAGIVQEFWAESSLARIYSASESFVYVGLGYRFHDHFSAGAEIALVDMVGNYNKSTLQLIPTVLYGNVLFGNENVEPFVGLGLSMVHFLETYPDNSISGSKVGLDFRSGVRIRTNLVQPQQHPSVDMGPKQLDIEISLGQRFHQMFGVGEGTGFNMSALRIGVGLNTRF